MIGKQNKLGAGGAFRIKILAKSNSITVYSHLCCHTGAKKQDHPCGLAFRQSWFTPLLRSTRLYAVFKVETCHNTQSLTMYRNEIYHP